MDLNKSSSVEALANANHIAKIEGGIEKEFKNLEYGGEFKMTCMNCDKEIATLMKISPRPTRIPFGGGRVTEVSHQRFQAKCPFCQNKTWIVKTEGQVMIGPTEETSYVGCDIGNPEDPEGMFNIVKVHKNEK